MGGGASDVGDSGSFKFSMGSRERWDTRKCRVYYHAWLGLLVFHDKAKARLGKGVSLKPMPLTVG